MSNIPEPNPEQPNSLPPDRWDHLNKYERKYAQNIIMAYDKIMQVTEDVCKIASRYRLSVEEVQRAKDYAFGSGVALNQFLPDEDMAAAWTRMASGQEIDIDEVLLRHEVFESNLVVNQGMNTENAHNLAQARYPWSELLKQRRYHE